MSTCSRFGYKDKKSTISCHGDEDYVAGLCYTSCRNGYHAVGSNICSPNCPSGWSDGGATCNRPSYGRGAGTILGCPPGTSKGNADLICYPDCRANYQMVGPVCWQNCPKGWVNCGAGCAATQEECAMVVADQVIAPIIVAANVATLGVTSPELTAAEAAEQGAVRVGTKYYTAAKKVGKAFLEVIDLLMKAAKAKEVVDGAMELFIGAYEEDFAEQTSAEINKTIDARFATENAHYIKEMWARKKFGEIAESDDYFKIAEGQLAFYSIIDPTGITGVASAYTKPQWEEIVPFPPLSQAYPPGVPQVPSTPPAPVPSSDSWELIAASDTAANIAVGYDYDLWIANSGGEIMHYFDGQWSQKAGSASDISEGADRNSTVWMIGTVAEAGGYGIYRRTDGVWEKVPGGAGVRISVGSDGKAWVVNDAGNIYHYNGRSWDQFPGPGPAKDIGVGPDGNVWVVGGNAEAGGYGIYRSTGATWDKFPGGGVRIAAGPKGDVWFVDDAGKIYEYPASAWTQPPPSTPTVPSTPGMPTHGAYVGDTRNAVPKPGVAKDIALSSNGVVWMVGTNSAGIDTGIYRWTVYVTSDKGNGSAEKTAGYSPN